MALVVDAFAGAGGWDEGARQAGYAGPLVGIDTDLAACRTAMAAGHARVCADVATYPLERLVGRVTGLAASPPCQAWSTAGNGGGRVDRVRCHALVDAYAAGRQLPAGTWTDPGSPLVAEPVRWVRALRPRWVALEQVPPVLPLWQHIAHVLRGWGYRTWCGILAAEAYGVPQTRRRAILVASLDGPVGPPEPTHQRYRAGRAPHLDADLFGPPLPPPVSMREALGWDVGGLALRNNNTANACERGIGEPAGTLYFSARANAVDWIVANGRQANATAQLVLRSNYGSDGDPDNRCERGINDPALTVTGRVRGASWVVDVGQYSRLGGGRTERYIRPVDAPSPTLVKAQRWTMRPATTVQGDSRIWPPGHKVDAEDIARLGEDEARQRYGDRAGTDAVRVTVRDAAILQGFPLIVEEHEITRDELCALALAQGHLTVEVNSGRVWRHRGPGGMSCPAVEVTGSNCGGYRVMSLRVGAVRKQVRLHRLVWIAAHGVLGDGLVIDHINGDKADNRIANLQVLTPSEHSRVGHERGQFNYRRKLDPSNDYELICEDRVSGMTRRALAEKYGVTEHRIKQILHDYPWQGTKTAQYQQVGNAIPPPLAAAILRPLLAIADYVRGAA